VTSVNMGHGPIRVPQISPTFSVSGTVALRWCSTVSERPVPAGADQYLSGPAGLDHGFGRAERRPVWTTAVGYSYAGFYPAGRRPDLRHSPPPTWRSSSCRCSAGARAPVSAPAWRMMLPYTLLLLVTWTAFYILGTRSAFRGTERSG